MGRNYHPTLGQASLIYGISEWALGNLVEDHNKRFPGKAIKPLVEASDSPALWQSSDIEPLVTRYHFLRDINQAMTVKQLKRLKEAIGNLTTKITELGQGPEVRAIEDRSQEGMSLKAEKEDNQKQRVIEELTKAQGNLTEASKRMGVHRQQLQKLVKKYGLSRRQFIPKPPETGEPEYHLMTYEKAKRAFEARYFKAVIEASGGNIARAGQASGLARQNLYEKIKRFSIDVEAIRESNVVDCSLFDTEARQNIARTKHR